MSLGLLGKKLGMTQVNEGESRVAVTIVEAGPCVVIQKKTLEKDGYIALKVGFGDKKAKNMPKAQRVIFENIKMTPKRWIREFRVTEEILAKYEVGQEIKLSDVFQENQIIDVVGTTKGRGFTGVLARWNMKGNRRTHGAHEFFRHGGSIGCRTFPGHVHKNKHMAGHYGVERVTVPNLRIVKILEDKGCLLISGSVPGAGEGFLELKPSKRYHLKAA
ncbi:MAG: 50S ribosomal protein L3 [Bdellovibrionales bacterium]|nr:50S ribosomal protein L3 [Bdellovibrionales bacterium]